MCWYFSYKIPPPSNILGSNHQIWNMKIIFLDTVPDKHVENRHKDNTCQAITISGKKCSFKSTCGIYCKKHYNIFKK